MFVFTKFKENVSFVRSNICIDNMVFKLHYMITLWFLIGCAVIVGSREFVKEHISCIAEKYLKHVINTYCFFSSTFTVFKHHNASTVTGSEAVHPGVGPYIVGQDEIIRHAYYQWVPFVLFFQALAFYVPHLIWQSIENGTLLAIVTTLPTITTSEKPINNALLETEADKQLKISWLKNKYLYLSRFKVNRNWGVYLLLCEVLNVVNLVLQIYIVNIFLQGKFIDLGIKWWNHEDVALDLVFPKVTKCTFHKYGHSGSLQVHDTICVMGLNIINEKIFCLMWFWFLALFIVTCLALVWRLLTFLLHSRSTRFNKFVWGELSPGPALKEEDIRNVTVSLTFGNWLFLYYLGKNVNGVMFREMISQISESKNKTSKPELEQEKMLVLAQPSPSQSYSGEESFC